MIPVKDDCVNATIEEIREGVIRISREARKPAMSEPFNRLIGPTVHRSGMTNHAQTNSIQESLDMKKSIILSIISLFIIAGLSAQPVQEINENAYLTYTDSRGVTISLDSPPDRIVSLSPNISETIFALDGRSLLVGRTDYCNYPEEVTTVPSVGDLMSPSLEKIISLEPDIVLVSTLGQNQTIEAIENAGIKVAYINESQSMEGTYSLIEDVGILIDRTQEASQLIDGMKEEIDKVTERISRFQKKTVYYVAGFGQWGDFTATGDTFLHEMIELAGGINVARDASNWTFSLEELLEQDPQIIILPPTWGATFEQTKDAFISYEAYQSLSAVINDSIYYVDGDILNRQGPRSAHAVNLLSRVIHPEL